MSRNAVTARTALRCDSRLPRCENDVAKIHKQDRFTIRSRLSGRSIIKRLVRQKKIINYFFSAQVRFTIEGPDTAQTIIKRSPGSFWLHAIEGPDTAQTIIKQFPGSFWLHAIESPDTAQTIIKRFPGSFWLHANEGPATAQTIIKRFPGSFWLHANEGPATAQAIIKRSPGSVCSHAWQL